MGLRPRPIEPYITRYGFVWPDRSGEGQDVTVTRVAQIKRSNGCYKILEVASTAAGDKLHAVEVYVSPMGRLRVFKGKKELR